MKKVATLIGIIGAFALGWTLGTMDAKLSARITVQSGPYSDDYQAGIGAIQMARQKLRAGDHDVLAELDQAERHFQNSVEWAERFLRRHR